MAKFKLLIKIEHMLQIGIRTNCISKVMSSNLGVTSIKRNYGLEPVKLRDKVLIR